MDIGFSVKNHTNDIGMNNHTIDIRKASAVYFVIHGRKLYILQGTELSFFGRKVAKQCNIIFYIRQLSLLKAVNEFLFSIMMIIIEITVIINKLLLLITFNQFCI